MPSREPGLAKSTLMLPAPDADMCEGTALMDGDVIRLEALNQILWFGPRGMVDVPLEPRVGNYFLEDHAADTPSFRVPFHDVTALERRSCLSCVSSGTQR
jgi:hypothetical protein